MQLSKASKKYLENTLEPWQDDMSGSSQSSFIEIGHYIIRFTVDENDDIYHSCLYIIDTRTMEVMYSNTGHNAWSYMPSVEEVYHRYEDNISRFFNNKKKMDIVAFVNT